MSRKKLPLPFRVQEQEGELHSLSTLQMEAENPPKRRRVYIKLDVETFQNILLLWLPIHRVKERQREEKKTYSGTRNFIEVLTIPSNVIPIFLSTLKMITSLEFSKTKFYMCGPGSSVGIATVYGLDGPGSNPGGDEIFRPSRPALGPT